MLPNSTSCTKPSAFDPKHNASNYYQLVNLPVGGVWESSQQLTNNIIIYDQYILHCRSIELGQIAYGGKAEKISVREHINKKVAMKHPTLNLQRNI